MTYTSINKKLGHRRAEHFFYPKTSQFALCTEKTYNELIDVFHIDEFSFFKPYEELENMNSRFKKEMEPTFNLNGNKYKSNVLEYAKSYNHFHPTEKPVDLLEDLILTYSNEGDLVLDFTMGSGSTGVACKNLNRDFIGIEKEEEFFNIAKNRCGFL
jgi:site-specific DNA-methyltransferase (adenine-specific)